VTCYGHSKLIKLRALAGVGPNQPTDPSYTIYTIIILAPSYCFTHKIDSKLCVNKKKVLLISSRIKCCTTNKRSKKVSKQASHAFCACLSFFLSLHCIISWPCLHQPNNPLSHTPCVITVRNNKSQVGCALTWIINTCLWLSLPTSVRQRRVGGNFLCGKYAVLVGRKGEDRIRMKKDTSKQSNL
jgi:hypothetical protein